MKSNESKRSITTSIKDGISNAKTNITKWYVGLKVGAAFSALAKANRYSKDATYSVECKYLTNGQTQKPMLQQTSSHPRSNKPIKVRVLRGLSISLVTPLALLVIRELVPGVAEQINPVYSFLDEVFLPILNWSYQLCMKAFEELMQQEWFQKLLQACNSLVQ